MQLLGYNPLLFDYCDFDDNGITIHIFLTRKRDCAITPALDSYRYFAEIGTCFRLMTYCLSCVSCFQPGRR